MIFRLRLVRRHHHRRYLSSANVRSPADHRQLASRSRQGHPLRDRLNTGPLLYEILPTDQPLRTGRIICDRRDRGVRVPSRPFFVRRKLLGRNADCFRSLEAK